MGPEMKRILLRCKCQRDIPVRVSDEVLRACAPLGAEAVVLTYGCRRCGIVTVTLAAFHRHMLRAA